MKRLDGKLSEEQQGMSNVLRGVGYNVIVALGADEAIRAVKAYCDGRGREK